MRSDAEMLVPRFDSMEAFMEAQRQAGRTVEVVVRMKVERDAQDASV